MAHAEEGQVSVIKKKKSGDGIGTRTACDRKQHMRNYDAVVPSSF
jgi:hypothetical protein